MALPLNSATLFKKRGVFDRINNTVFPEPWQRLKGRREVNQVNLPLPTRAERRAEQTIEQSASLSLWFGMFAVIASECRVDFLGAWNTT